MKRFILALAFSLCFFIAAAQQDGDTYEYNNLVATLEGTSEPHISGNFMVFTADKSAHSVGIAFDFENYRTVHYFHLRKTTNFEGEVTNSWWFYIAPKPPKKEQISYRLVIDGLWTTDPMNPKTVFDEDEGIELSQLLVPEKDPIVTETLESGLTRFVCFAKSGQKIRLGGSFTNWDSWIYSMIEVAPGRYELELPLPQGTHYYAYYSGMTSFIDTTNPLKGYNSEGKVVSCININ